MIHFLHALLILGHQDVASRDEFRSFTVSAIFLDCVRIFRTLRGFASRLRQRKYLFIGILKARLIMEDSAEIIQVYNEVMS